MKLKILVGIFLFFIIGFITFNKLDDGDLATFNESFFSIKEIDDEIKERMLGKSMKYNAKINFNELRYLQITYYGYDNESHIGEMVVNKAVAEEVINIFMELYNAKFPIERMVLIDDYNADDELSMRNNNTSAFNYRAVLGSSKLSYHSMGLAIDINPLYNPYYNFNTNVIQPKTAEKYLNRNNIIRGMILKNSFIVDTFKKYGWIWGGDWTNSVDYQHFEKHI